MPSQINRVLIAGNLTRDPELRSLQTGTSVCRMRIANNTRRKVGEEWTDKANYFDVTVWGQQGERCASALSKGSPVVIDGRLEWREWATDDGSKRQAVDIIAENVQFPRGSGGARDDGWTQEYGGEPVAAGASAPPPDDDIPF